MIVANSASFRDYTKRLSAVMARPSATPGSCSSQKRCSTAGRTEIGFSVRQRWQRGNAIHLANDLLYGIAKGRVTEACVVHALPANPCRLDLPRQ